MPTALAYDLGAGSGRALLGRLTDSRMQVQELHRFPNDPVSVRGRLHWDVLRLYHEMKTGLHEGSAAGRGGRIDRHRFMGG